MTSGSASSPTRYSTHECLISGINHILLVTNDMDATVEFYCGLLGLKVKVTFGNNFKPGGMIATTGDMVTSISDYSRIYFFELS